MGELFLTVLNMSLTASYVILFVMAVRLLLKKAPKAISYVLWSVVAFRLVIPFSFESMFSLMPRSTNVAPIPRDIIYQQSPQFNSGIEAMDSFVNQRLPVPTVEASVNPLQIYTGIAACIWFLGILVLLIYSLVSVLKLKSHLKDARLIEKNIYEAQNLRTPFVLGLVSPKIYLPFGLSKEEQNYILIHEQTHIHRKDHIIKALAFLIVSVHWFNPLVWIAFMLMSTDMELSCDERVLKVVNEDIKKPYANSLLSLATGRHILNGSPLAFGEGNIKGRIKNVLSYKKPRFWILTVSIFIVLVIGMGLISNPKSNVNNDDPITGFAREIMNRDIAMYELNPEVKIIDSKITRLELIETFDDLADFPIEVYALEYRLLPEDLSKVAMAGGMDTDEKGWLKETCSMGSPLLVVSRNNGSAEFIGNLWTGGVIEDGGLEESIKELLKKVVNEEEDIEKEEDDIGKLVEDNLAIIMSSPKQASNPHTYIQEHQQEYENIIKFGGEEALQYMFSQFAKGNAEGLRGHIMMQLCKELLGVRNNVTDETLTPQEWYNALSIRHEIKLPDFKYDGNDPIEKLVYDTEIKQNSSPQRGFTIVAPKIFGSYEDKGLLKVFTTTFSGTYKLYGNVLELELGAVVPAAITYKKGKDGNWVLEKYEQAKDGAYFIPSIREFCTMPATRKKIPGLADEIIAHYTNYDDIRTLHWKNLYKHLKEHGINDATLFDPDGEVKFSMRDPRYAN